MMQIPDSVADTEKVCLITEYINLIKLIMINPAIGMIAKYGLLNNVPQSSPIPTPAKSSGRTRVWIIDSIIPPT